MKGIKSLPKGLRLFYQNPSVDIATIALEDGGNVAPCRELVEIELSSLIKSVLDLPELLRDSHVDQRYIRRSLDNKYLYVLY